VPYQATSALQVPRPVRRRRRGIISASVCQNGRVTNTASLFALMGLVMALLGVFGYLTERRKRGASSVRRFLLWYAFTIPFIACGLCGVAYPKLHWLGYPDFAVAVVVALLARLRRALPASAQGRDESSRMR
jgi:hypothetical protein